METIVKESWECEGCAALFVVQPRNLKRVVKDLGASNDS